MLELIPQQKKETEKSSADKFYLLHDPRQEDAVTQETAMMLLNKIQTIPEGEERTEFIKQHTAFMIRMFQHRDPEALKLLVNQRLAAKEFESNRRMIMHNAMGHEQVFAHLKTNYEALTEFELGILISGVQNQCNSKFQLEHYNLTDQRTFLLSPDLLNPLTAYFVDNVFLNLERKINKDLPGEIQNYSSRSDLYEKIVLLGYLFGKFDPSDPNAEKHKQLLYPCIKYSDFQELKEKIKPKSEEVPQPRYAEKVVTHEEADTDSEKLQKLKEYWSTAFVAKWAASAKKEYDGFKYLSQADRVLGHQQVVVTQASADNLSGATKQAEAAYARTEHWKSSRKFIDEYVQAEQEIDAKVSQSQKKLRTFTAELLAAYNPELQKNNMIGFMDEKGKPVGEWSIFQEKVGRLLDVFVKKANLLRNNHLEPAALEKILKDTASGLIEVLETGARKLEVTTLFGSSFSMLPEIEQVALIVFTALTLAKAKDKPHLAVEIVSNRFNTLLQNSRDRIVIETEIDTAHQLTPPLPPYVRPTMNGEDLLQKTKAAKGRLQSLSQKNDLVLSTQDSRFVNLMEQQTEQVEKYAKFMEESGNILEKVLRYQDAYIAEAGLGLAFGVISTFNTLTLTYNMNASAEYQVNPASTLFWCAFTAFLSLCSFSLSRYSQLQDEKRSAIRSTLKTAKALEPSLQDEINNLEKKLAGLKLEATLGLKFVDQFVAGAMLSLIIGFGGIGAVVGSHREVELPPAATVTPEITPTPAPTTSGLEIPDQMDQEALRQSEPIFQGDILHLGSNFSESDGSTIGFQTTGWFDHNREAYESGTLLPFRDAEIVPNLEQVNYVASDEETVYTVTNISQIVYPISDRLEITRVFQVGGDAPSYDLTGRLVFTGELPTALMLVTRPREVINGEYVASPLYTVPSLSAEQYSPTIPESGVLLTEQIQDPELQSLHQQMMKNATELRNSFNSGTLSEQDYQTAYSRLAEQSIADFIRYVNRNHNYSLLYQPSGATGEYSSLLDMSADPNSDFYCTVGNFSLIEYMASIGVRLLQREGSPMFQYQDQLFTQFGHINSVILYPDGTIGFTDATPNTPNPDEDLSALDRRLPPPNPMEQESENTAQRIALLVSAVLGVATITGIKQTEKLRKKIRKLGARERLNKILDSHTKKENNVMLSQIEDTLQLVIEYASDKQKQAAWNLSVPFSQMMANDLTKYITRAQATGEVEHLLQNQLLSATKQAIPASTDIQHEDLMVGSQQRVKKALETSDAESPQITIQTLRSIAKMMKIETQKHRSELVSQINGQIKEYQKDERLLFQVERHLKTAVTEDEKLHLESGKKKLGISMAELDLSIKQLELQLNRVDRLGQPTRDILLTIAREIERQLKVKNEPTETEVALPPFMEQRSIDTKPRDTFPRQLIDSLHEKPKQHE